MRTTNLSRALTWLALTLLCARAGKPELGDIRNGRVVTGYPILTHEWTDENSMDLDTEEFIEWREDADLIWCRISCEILTFYYRPLGIYYDEVWTTNIHLPDDGNPEDEIVKTYHLMERPPPLTKSVEEMRLVKSETGKPYNWVIEGWKPGAFDPNAVED